jgi:hypothetical protein
MKYVLECTCGSRKFEYDGKVFICFECLTHIPEQDAGLHLISEEE